MLTQMSDYEKIDLAILDTIDSIREDHNACTARAVASALRTSPDVVRYRLQKMKNEGVVTWTDMAGSLIKQTPVPLKLVEALAETTDEEPQDSASPATSSSTPKKKRASQRSRPAAD